MRPALHILEFLFGCVEIARVECLDTVGEAIVITAILARNFLRHDIAVLLRVFVSGVFLRGSTIQASRFRDVSLPGGSLCLFIEVFLFAGKSRDGRNDQGES